MNIHEEIKQKLAAGERVYSFAVGRVGQIVSVDDHPLFPVNIISVRGRKRPNGATTFLAGDKVKLVHRAEYRGGPAWAVVNEDLV